MKVKKKSKAPQGAEAVEEVVEETETVEEGAEGADESTEETEEGDEESEEAEEAPAPPVKTVSAKAKTVAEPVTISAAPKKGGYVKFSCIRTIEPPPIVGHFDIARELKITKMAQGAQYELPKHVAEHLHDAKAGFIG